MSPPSRAKRAPQLNKPDKVIVVPVLGPTGSGKSTFINCLLGEEKMKVGNYTASCTTKPQPASIIHPPDFPILRGHRLVLLDTPGFDDTYREDAEILKCIAGWLTESRRNGNLVGGVLYFHDISTRRFTSAANGHLEMLTRLCGAAGLKKTVIVTTNWGSSDNDEPDQRELDQRELHMKEGHWSAIIQNGGEVRRFLRNQKSAWDIIDVLLQCADLQAPLLIQQQLADEQMSFGETEAGKYSSSVAKEKKSGKRRQEWAKWALGCVVQ